MGGGNGGAIADATALAPEDLHPVQDAMPDSQFTNRNMSMDYHTTILNVTFQENFPMGNLRLKASGKIGRGVVDTLVSSSIHDRLKRV